MTVVVEVGETLSKRGEVPVILTKVIEVLETSKTATEVEEVLTKVAEAVEALNKMKGAGVILNKMVGVWEALTKTAEVVETFTSVAVEDSTKVGEALLEALTKVEEALLEALTKEREAPISSTKVEKVWVKEVPSTMREARKALIKGEEALEILTWAQEVGEALTMGQGEVEVASIREGEAVEIQISATKIIQTLAEGETLVRGEGASLVQAEEDAVACLTRLCMMALMMHLEKTNLIQIRAGIITQTDGKETIHHGDQEVEAALVDLVTEAAAMTVGMAGTKAAKEGIPTWAQIGDKTLHGGTLGQGRAYSIRTVGRS